jgi:rSAM/selenodomain-associated transferase 1
VTALAIVAKEPVPGRVKTRLCPPCSASEAARLAEAALRDTVDRARATSATRVVLVLDGRPPPGLTDLDVVPQRSGELGERLAGAFADVGEPLLLIGMDTPQVSVELLDEALAGVRAGEAVLGPALDGGWWALGLRACPPGAFAGVPMSTASTCRHQLARLRSVGIDPRLLDELRDVDRWADALAVAGEAPGSRFAEAVAGVGRP